MMSLFDEHYVSLSLLNYARFFLEGIANDYIMKMSKKQQNYHILSYLAFLLCLGKNKKFVKDAKQFLKCS